LKAAGGPYRVDRYLVAQAPGARGWVTAFGAAGAIAIAYSLAARLGFSASGDVAAFWPATGVAAGNLIVSGLPAAVIGTVVSTVAANLMSHRSFVTCLVNGSRDAGEVVLAACLLAPWIGRPFTLVDLRREAGFLAATSFTTAASTFRAPGH